MILCYDDMHHIDWFGFYPQIYHTFPLSGVGYYVRWRATYERKNGCPGNPDAASDDTGSQDGKWRTVAGIVHKCVGCVMSFLYSPTNHALALFYPDSMRETMR